jgi:hypothetical protein
MRRLNLVPFAAWIPAALMLPLVIGESTHHDGWTAEASDLSAPATVIAVLAALALGYAYSRRLPVWLLLAVTVLVTRAYLSLHELTLEYLLQVDGKLTTLLDLLWLLIAAAAGLGLGRLRPAREPRRASAGSAIGAAAAAGIVGLLLTHSFVTIAAEAATTGIGTGGRSAPAQLPAGEHALFTLWGSGECDVTADGEPVELDRPRIQLTDNSDSIVNVFVGTFTLGRPATVAASCDNASLGAPPVTREPMRTLIFGPPVWMWLIGLLTGVLTGLSMWLSRRRPVTAATVAQAGVA